MPKPNRVTPFGEVVAVPERGTCMGNRGVLHDAEGRIRRAWRLRRWIVCVLEFRDRKRRVMTPGRYTELFFLDEATALAAGHRPCAECRHACFLAFCNAWGLAQRDGKTSARPSAQGIDDRLHAERVAPDRSKRSCVVPLDGLPEGVFVTVPVWGEEAYLVRGGYLLAWSPGGYCERRGRPKGAEVKVLTPPSTVAAIRAGYAPEVHSSAVALA